MSDNAELPIDGLPESVRGYIEAVCEIYHCPREFVTAAVLATASTAVGKKIIVNEGKYKNNVVLWFVLVARSGSNKSYPIKLVTEPIREIDKALYIAFRQKYEEWNKLPKNDRGDAPKCPGIVLEDCTDERRSEVLYMNSDTYTESETGCATYESRTRGAIGIYPELKGMFDSKNQYQNGGTAGISKLLRLFDCEDIKVDRKQGGTMLIKNPFCNILGDLQTSLLRSTFGSELFMTNGMNQRFLFCLVEDIEYPKREKRCLAPEIKDRWAETVKLLYDGIYHALDGTHRTLFRNADGVVTLSAEADTIYDEYYNTLQIKKDAAGSDYEASLYSKLQIQVLRFAGIVHALHIAEGKGNREDYHYIGADVMEYSVRCMAYFENTALRVYKKLTEQPEVKQPAEASNGDFIKQFLARYPNVSQNRLAMTLGVSPAYISKCIKK